MTFYLLDVLDIPTRPRQTKQNQDTSTLRQKAQELRNLVESRRHELNLRKSLVMQKEADLQKYAPKEWKKLQQRRQQKLHSWTGPQTDGQTINLAATTGATTATVGVSTASLPGTTEATSSPLGSFLMICTALLLCASSALIYRKKTK